jgi:carbonic anhydrase
MRRRRNATSISWTVVDPVPERVDAEALSPAEALARLVEGNSRFVATAPAHPDQGRHRREVLRAAQHPFASIFACADSRVPPEVVFDQGLGDLFVVRSAGQVVDGAILGTLEFGVAQLWTPLLVVLGHSHCGAVRATVEAVETHAPATETHIDTLVAGIIPAVSDAESDGATGEDLLRAAAVHNVERVVARLRSAPVISAAVEAGTVEVVGAFYHLSTGAVEVLTV